MASKPRISVTIHRHGRPDFDDITDQVTKVEWSQSLSAPWQSLTVTWKATVGDSFVRVMEGDWVLFRIISEVDEGRGSASGLLHVDSTSGGVSVTPSGGIATYPCTFKATSWWNFLTSVNIYSVLGWTQDIGTLLSIGSWGNILISVTEEYGVGALSESFKNLFNALTKSIKLPQSLFSSSAKPQGKTDMTIADAVSVICDQSTLDFLRSPSSTTGVPVAPSNYVIDTIDIAGGLPTRLASGMGAYESTIVDFLVGTYVSDPMLIELFPTAIPEVTDAPSSAAGYHFGFYNALILRLKPFREIPLKDSMVAHAGYRSLDVEKAVSSSVAASVKQDPLWALKTPFGAGQAYRDAQNSANAVASHQMRNKYAVEQFLDKNFNKVTWDYSTFTNIDSSLVRSMTWGRDDRNRVNCSSIKLSFDNQTGIEGLMSAGLPITYDEEILRHGLRVSKPTWSYMINTSVELRDRLLENKRRRAAGQPLLPPITTAKSSTDGEWVAFARTICAQFMQFYKNNHMYLKGTITLNLTEALKDRNSPGLTEKVLNLQHGQPFALSLHRDMDVIFGYCESISHTFTIGDGGIEAGLTTIEYSRGHVGVAAEALRDDVEVPIRPAAQQKSSTPTTSSTSTASSKNNCTVVSTYGPAKSNKALRLDAGVRIYATMRAAGFSPALSFALAHQASFESGWDPDAVRWCRKDEFATDIGLFQINYAGMGKAREGFQDKKPADTRYSSRYDSTKHWDASDPNLNCQRVIYGLKKLGFEANKKYKSLEEAYHAVWFDSYLTSGQAKSGLYDFRNNKGKTLYVEPRRYLVGASWADGKATYNMTGAVSTPFPRGVIVTGCNPSAYNVTGVGTLSSDKKSVTVSMTTNPGVWILGGLLSTKPWEDSTFTDRYESLDGIFNPNNNYFTDTRTNDKLGVADGIIKLLAQRFGL